MKLKNIWLCVAMVLGLHACDNEDVLLPNPPGEGIIYEFPEGTNAWDQDLQEIAEKFGTKCIYKNLTLTDLLRSWVSTSSATEYVGQGLINERQVKLYTRFLKDHVFRFLNPEVTRDIVPNYIFFAYDYCSVNSRPLPDGSKLVYHGLPKTQYNGMGFWAFCFETEEHLNIMGNPWKQEMFTAGIDVLQNRELILKNIFNLLLEAGMIVPPAQFAVGGGLDYKTPIVYGATNTGDENYFKRRGFPETIRNFVKVNASSSDLYQIIGTGPLVTFADYLWLAFRYPRKTILENYKDFPLVIQYYELTVTYMKEKYGMDVSLIAEMPEDLES